MSKKIIVPEVDVEIGENLFLRLKEVRYFPGDPGKTTGAYEDCYPPTDPEIDWKDENACLLIRKVKYVTTDGGKSTAKKVDEYDFSIDPSFVCEYYDAILEATEEILNEQ